MKHDIWYGLSGHREHVIAIAFRWPFLFPKVTDFPCPPLFITFDPYPPALILPSPFPPSPHPLKIPCRQSDQPVLGGESVRLPAGLYALEEPQMHKVAILSSAVLLVRSDVWYAVMGCDVVWCWNNQSVCLMSISAVASYFASFYSLLPTISLSKYSFKLRRSPHTPLTLSLVLFH